MILTTQAKKVKEMPHKFSDFKRFDGEFDDVFLVDLRGVAAGFRGVSICLKFGAFFASFWLQLIEILMDFDRNFTDW